VAHRAKLPTESTAAAMVVGTPMLFASVATGGRRSMAKIKAIKR
jgi:hypothetical protein